MAKKLTVATIVVFIFIFIYEWVFHGMLLKGIYEQTPELWRSQAEMGSYMKFMILGQLLFALFMCLEFSRNHQCTGVAGGAKFGFYIGGLFAAMNIGMYAWMPLPSLQLPILWSVGAMIQTILIGIILALFCCRKCDKKEA